MDCLHARRLLLADSGAQSSEAREHLAACRDCARFARELASLEPTIEGAVLVPIPDALAPRVLLGLRRLRSWRYAGIIAAARAAARHVEKLFGWGRS